MRHYFTSPNHLSSLISQKTTSPLKLRTIPTFSSPSKADGAHEMYRLPRLSTVPIPVQRMEHRNRPPVSQESSLRFQAPPKQTAHMKCAVSQDYPTVPIPVQRMEHRNRPPVSTPISHILSSVPSPGRRLTRARGLYVSSLANFRVSDPKYGAEHRTCEADN